MTKVLGDIEPILKNIYQEVLTNQLKRELKLKAAFQGWKRNRKERIKWTWKMLFK